MEATRVLLRSKANLSLLLTPADGAQPIAPLAIAAQNGFNDVVRELLQHGGLRGIRGALSGIDALSRAAGFGHVDVVATLADAGTFDDGQALLNACGAGHEDCVIFLLLLQQRVGNKNVAYRGRVYLNLTDGSSAGRTPLLESIDVGINKHCCPRIARLLVDAGADTMRAIKFTRKGGDRVVHETPLEFTTRKLEEKKVAGEAATEEQLRRLEAVRRLLLRVEAVHAVSWLWSRDAPGFTYAREGHKGELLL